jgi:hypothetical protein
MDTSTINPPKRRRGRPCRSAGWLSLDEVSAITGAAPDVLERLLQRVPEAIPGALRERDGWTVPERGLRVLLGAQSGPLPVHATVDEVAACVRRSVKTVYKWLQVLGPDGRPMLPHRRVLGMILVPVSAVLALPAVLPGPRSSFFSSQGGGADE